MFVRERYDAYGAEPSEGMRNFVSRRLPELAGRISDGALPDLAARLGRRFDGVLCSGVFQHIPRVQQFDGAFDVRNRLKPNGRLLLSVPKEGPGIDSTDRDRHGRLFVMTVPEALELLFERLGFQRIGRWEDEDSIGRPGVSWTTILFDLRSDQALRPIDQIEGVLNRDKKVATYKLALFRALCDIALTNYHIARWLPDGRVAVPVGDVAERWIYYCWPLFENGERFFPQIRGERPGGRLRIGFRPHLEKLIAEFRRSGGLDGFESAMRNDSFDAPQRGLLDSLLRKLASVIKEGPVMHAGRSSGAGELFEYPKSRSRRHCKP